MSSVHERNVGQSASVVQAIGWSTQPFSSTGGVVSQGGQGASGAQGGQPIDPPVATTSHFWFALQSLSATHSLAAAERDDKRPTARVEAAKKRA
jgi:hypothetical protein